MKFTRIVLVFSLFGFLMACDPSQVDLNREKRVEVIAVHDEVMPKLGQLKSFEKKAVQRAEELEAIEPIDSTKIMRLNELAKELNQAYEGMFDWMRQYEVDDDGKTPEEIKIYLEEQMILVTQVNRDIKGALAKADSLLVD